MLKDNMVRMIERLEAQNKQLRTALLMGVQLCESGGHGKGDKCPTCHFMREAQKALLSEERVT